MGALGQRFVKQLGIAGLDPLSVDEDPAAIANEPVAVFAVAGGDQSDAVGVNVSDREVGMAVVAVGFSGRRRARGRDEYRAGIVHSQPPLGDVVVVSAPVGHLPA